MIWTTTGYSGFYILCPLIFFFPLAERIKLSCKWHWLWAVFVKKKKHIWWRLLGIHERFDIPRYGQLNCDRSDNIYRTASPDNRSRIKLDWYSQFSHLISNAVFSSFFFNLTKITVIFLQVSKETVKNNYMLEN